MNTHVMFTLEDIRPCCSEFQVVVLAHTVRGVDSNLKWLLESSPCLNNIKYLLSPGNEHNLF